MTTFLEGFRAEDPMAGVNYVPQNLDAMVTRAIRAEADSRAQRQWRFGSRSAIAVAIAASLTGATLAGAAIANDQSTTATTIHAPGSPTTIPSTTAPSTTQELLNQSGQGSGVTKEFAASATPWTLNWSIICGSKRGGGTFNLLKKTTSGYESVGSPSVKIAESYDANAIFRQAGVFKIDVSTSCAWNAFVTEPK